MAPQLTDGRVLLRPPRPGDEAELVTAVQESQPDIGRWLAWAGPGYGRAEAASWCQQGHQAHGSVMHVIDAVNGRLLGGMGLQRSDERNGTIELGYWTRSSARGRGVAVAGASLLSSYAFTALGYERVELVIAVGNTASQRVADKLGATLEGRLGRRLRLGGGELSDALLYALFRRPSPDR